MGEGLRLYGCAALWRMRSSSIRPLYAAVTPAPPGMPPIWNAAVGVGVIGPFGQAVVPRTDPLRATLTTIPSYQAATCCQLPATTCAPALLAAQGVPVNCGMTSNFRSPFTWESV